MTTAFVWRRLARSVVLVAVAAVLATMPAVPGMAAPGGSGTDNEGGTPTLREVLDNAARGYNDAKGRLEASRKRQLELELRLHKVEGRLAELTQDVGVVAATAYRTGRLGPVSALLNSSSPDEFLQRAAVVDMLAKRDDIQLRELKRTRELAAAQKARIDAEVHLQTLQLAVMKKKKQQAERALAQVGGAPTGGYVSVNSPAAKPAPRNPDGSWPSESCTVDDPTTSGCITPRMLHALQEAQRAGFTHFVSCYRSGGSGEHPKGRACDFAADTNGFGGTATGSSRTYGNNLAAFFVRNADALGVLYVIWYKQIWFPGSGWRSYSGCCDPASMHTNHVHLSVQ